MRRLVLGLALAVSDGAGFGDLACAQALGPADIGDWRWSREVTSPPANVYAHSMAGQFSAAVKGVPERVYVPNVASHDVYVIDPGTMKVVDHYEVGRGAQRIVPSWDLKARWVTGSAESHAAWGSLASIDASITWSMPSTRRQALSPRSRPLFARDIRVSCDEPKTRSVAVPTSMDGPT